MSFFAFRDYELIFPDSYSESSFIHIPYIVQRNALFLNNLMEFLEILTYASNIFWSLTIRI